MHKIGKIYLKYKKYDESIKYSKEYLRICTEMTHVEGHKVSKMEALATLSECYMGKDETEEAMKYVSEYQKMTEGQLNKDLLYMKADSEKHLANLLWKKGEYERALQNYSSFFLDARKDKSRKDSHLVNNARISYGLAKGTYNIENHISRILKSKNDLFPLIDWKLSREKKSN